MYIFFKNRLYLIFFIFLVGCSPAKIISDKSFDKNKTEKVLIKNVAGNWIQAFGKYDIIFGYDDNDRYEIIGGNIRTLNIPIGKQEIFVRSKFSHRNKGKTKITLDIKRGNPTCLIVTPITPYNNHKAKSGFFGNFLYYFTPAYFRKYFYLDKVDCKNFN